MEKCSYLCKTSSTNRYCTSENHFGLFDRHKVIECWRYFARKVLPYCEMSCSNGDGKDCRIAATIYKSVIEGPRGEERYKDYFMKACEAGVSSSCEKKEM